MTIPYWSDIQSASQRHGVPAPYLAGLIAQESGFRPSAVGDNNNSFGMGQFNTRGALADLGLTGQQILAMSPAQQIDLTAEFYKRKLKQAGGDPRAALRRYNGGGDPKYVQHVSERMRELGLDPGRSQPVRKERSGDAWDRPTVPQDSRITSMDPQQFALMQQQAMMQQPQQQQFGQPQGQPPSMLQSMAQNPFLQMGLGILGAPGGNPLRAIAGGAQHGMIAAQMALESQAKLDQALQMQRMEMEEKSQKRLDRAKLRQQADMVEGVDPIGAAILRSRPEAYPEYLATQAEQGARQRSIEGLRYGGGMPQQPPQGMPGVMPQGMPQQPMQPPQVMPQGMPQGEQQPPMQPQPQMPSEAEQIAIREAEYYGQKARQTGTKDDVDAAREAEQRVADIRIAASADAAKREQALQQKIADEERAMQQKIADERRVKPQAGYEMDPDNPGAVRPVSGTAEDQKRIATKQAVDSGIAKISRMQEIMKKEGTTVISNSALRGEMEQLRAGLIANIAAARGMGVIQPGELENIEASLKDPASWASLFTGGDRIKAQFETLKKEFQDKRTSLEGGNPLKLDL